MAHTEVARGVWALAEAMGLGREAEALASEYYEEYGEEAMGMLAEWLAEHGGTELLAEAEVGAEVCVAHWEAEEDAEMVAEAEARRDRLARGEATTPDILGARDWASLRTEAEGIVADRDSAHTVASRLAERVLGGSDYDEVAQSLADTYEEWGCEVGEAQRLANEHLGEALADEDTDIAEEEARVLWYEYCEEEATDEQIADVLALAREIGTQEAVWCVADAQ